MSTTSSPDVDAVNVDAVNVDADRSDLRRLGKSTSTTVSKTGGREVFGFMSVAVVFAIIGNEIKVAKSPAKKVPTILTDSGAIIFGGFTAAAALTLLSHAGEGGRQFAVGLAAVTMLSSMLVYGGPVWEALGTATGRSKSTSGSTPTAPINVQPTNPTPATAGSHPIYIV